MNLSVAFRFKAQGGHTWVRVFAGPDADHRAKCGDLTFTNDEWAALSHWLPMLQPGIEGVIEDGSSVTVELVDETGD